MSKTKAPFYLNPVTARTYFDAIRGTDSLVEVRIPKAFGTNGTNGGARSFIAAGWFDNFDALHEQLATRIGDYDGGAYLTLNTIHDGLLARKDGHNQIKSRVDTTKDSEITRRKFMVIDLDPKRPADISSTNAEHEAAQARAGEIFEWMVRDLGFPEPMVCDSGNGFHLIFRIDLPTNDAELVRRCLAAVGARFPEEPDAAGICVGVDQTMFNPSRISKMVGTVAKKGGNTAERPWRMSRILHMPDGYQDSGRIATREALEALAALAPAAPAGIQRIGATGGGFSPATLAVRPSHAPSNAPTGLTGTAYIEDLIARHHLKVKGPKPWSNGGSIWSLWEDPITGFNDGSCFLGVQSSGAYFAGCHHNSAKWGWAEFMDALGEQRGSSSSMAELEAQYGAFDNWVVLTGLYGAPNPPAAAAEQAKAAKKEKKEKGKGNKDAPVAPVQANDATHQDTQAGANGAPDAPAPAANRGVCIFETVQQMANHFIASEAIGVCPVTGRAAPLLRAYRGGMFSRVALSTGGPGRILPHFRPIGVLEFDAIVRSRAAGWRRKTPKGNSAPLDLTRKTVGDIQASLRAIPEVLISDKQEAPMWLSDPASCPFVELGETCVFRDGVLDLVTGKLHPHSPYMFQTYSFDCYAPNITETSSQPEAFLNWVRSDLFPGDPDAERLLQEWCGYVLTARADLQKGMMIIGPPASGKSALLDLMGKLYGDAAIGLDLSSVASQFSLANCVGRRLLTVADARIDPNKRGGELLERLLQMIGQDTMSFDRKFLDPYVGKFPCRLMIASNEVPQIREASQAISRRFLILKTTKTIAPERQDPKMVDKLLASERESIIAWMLMGWLRLRANNYQWTVVESANDLRADLRRAGGSVAAFVEDCLLISKAGGASELEAGQWENAPGNCKLIDDIYSVYADYCDAQSIGHRVSPANFSRTFETATGLARSRMRTKDGKRVTVFAGVIYNDDGIEEIKAAKADIVARRQAARDEHGKFKFGDMPDGKGITGNGGNPRHGWVDKIGQNGA